MTRYAPLAALLLAALTFIAGAVHAQQMDRDALRDAVRDILIENPDIVIEAIEAYQEQEEVARQAQVTTRIAELRAELAAGATMPSVGAVDAPVTVIEFYDYECGFCKRAFADVLRLADSPDVRVVFVEFPILSDTSTAASKAALAAHEQGRFLAYHTALMEFPGRKTEEVLVDTAQRLDLDMARWEADRASPEIEAQIEANRGLATDLQLTGTPAFVIGDRIVPGAVGYDQLRGIVEEELAEG